MSAARLAPRNADSDAAFDEGVQAFQDGAAPNATNPYDDWAFERALKAGWRDGFAAAQSGSNECTAAEGQS